MRRTKPGPALFELLGDDEFRSQRDESGEQAPRDEAGGGTNYRARDDEAPHEAEVVASDDTDVSGFAEDGPDSAGRVSWPVFEFDGERLRVSLTSVGAAVVAFLAILALVGSFLLGQQRGHKAGLADGYEAGRASYAAAAMSEIEAARQQQPARHLIGDLLEDGEAPGGRPVDRDPAASPTQNPTTTTPGPTWIEDYTYVVVQEFGREARSDAEAAQEYLVQFGVPTEIVTLDDGRIHLMTRQGFNRKEPTQRKLSDQLLEKVRAIGSQYFAAGGRYRLEGYLKTYKGDL